MLTSYTDGFNSELDSLFELNRKNTENKKSIFGFLKRNLTEDFINKTTALIEKVLVHVDGSPQEKKYSFTFVNPLLNRLDQLAVILTEDQKNEKLIALAAKTKLLMKKIYFHGPYPIELPSKHDRVEGKIAMVVDDILSEEECKEWIGEAERIGFVRALVNGKESDERKSDRCFIISPERASTLYERLKPFLPQQMDSRVLAGVNDRFTMLRYKKGDFFGPHLDGFVQKDEQKSYFTVMLYFKGDTKGGDTAFLENFQDERDKMKVVEVTPRTGRALIFEHKVIHESTPLIDGVKYAARADILYAKNAKE